MLKVVGASWMQIRMSTWIIGVVLVLGIIVVILGQIGETEEDGNYSATVFWNQETGFEIKFWGQGMNIDQIPKGVARIYFQLHTETTGWAIVDILTQSNYPDWVQAYAAGMLEGSLSWQMIYWHWKNTVKFTCENREIFCNYVREYLEENLNSVKENYQNKEDPYWYQIYLFYVQLEGLQQGFEHGVKRSRQSVEELKFVDFLWMNAASDILDLEHKFLDTRQLATFPKDSRVSNRISNSTLLKKIKNSRSLNGYSKENQNSEAELRLQLGCGVTLASAFAKLLPEEGQFLIAHNSAGPYVTMLKMIKHYRFKFHFSSSNLWVIDDKMTFSSYPGVIHSSDGFYVLSVGSGNTDLVIAGTPLTVFNKNLWQFVSPKDQVLSGPRTIAASRLSKNASAWADTVSRYNSGTGNKQWMIIDAEIFINISRLRQDDEEKYKEELNKATEIFLLAELIPGHFAVKDLTHIFRSKTYWATYGLPFYEKIFNLSGVDKIKERNGDMFSFENSPLAKIYRRDHKNATSANFTMELMRSNSYRTDPFSLGDPRCAIGARGDIPSKASFSFPIGVTDSKVFLMEEEISSETIPENSTKQFSSKSRNFQVVAGPPHSLSPSRTETKEMFDAIGKNIIKPFNWAKSIFVDFPHEGQPDIWDFDPIDLK